MGTKLLSGPENTQKTFRSFPLITNTFRLVGGCGACICTVEGQ